MPAPRRRSTSPKRELLRLNLRGGSPDDIAEALHTLLEQTPLDHEERVQLLAGAVVVEALRPFWSASRTPQEAHDALRRTDPEMADAIEALAPMLLGRAEAHETARAALAEVESLLLGT